MTLPPRKKVTIRKADMSLQAKAGTGVIAPERIAKSQKIIDTNKMDFAPTGLELLGELTAVVTRAQTSELQVRVADIVRPIMAMKANAAMFGYPLFSSLASGLLDFLEGCEIIDADILQIVEAHGKILRLVIDSRMNGSGGAHGEAFRQELEQMRLRYINKQARR